MEGRLAGRIARARLLAFGTCIALACALAVINTPPVHAAPNVPSAAPSHGNGNPSGPKADLLKYKSYRSGQTAPRSITSSASVASVNLLATATAQNAAMASISTVGGAWRNIGPAPLGTFRGGLFGIGATAYPDETGRVLALANSGNTVYLGAADGGIWKSTNLGGSWTPLGDRLESLAIGTIAVAPGGGTILAGTGELADATDAIRGVGIYRSTDGGQTWTLTGRANFGGESVSAIRFDPSSPSRVFAAHTNGLAMSTDGGQTWTNLTDAGVNLQRITDLDIDSAGNLFAARGGWHDSGNGIYYSTDHGSTWTRVYTFGGSNTWNWKLALAPSTAGLARSSQVLYAVVGDTTDSSHLAGIFRSRDGGVNWTQVATASSLGDTSNQAWYDIYVAVKPTDPNTAFVGLVDIYRTTDGGSSWSNKTTVYGLFPGAIHPDQHAALFMGGTILFGNDGGVYKSTDNGDSYSSANGTGLSLTQYYGGDISATASGTMLGGAQDNGNSLTTNGGGSWTDYTSGDGFYTAIDFNNPRNLYTEYINGKPQYSNDGGGSYTSVCSGLNQPGLCTEMALFGAPLVMDPSNASTLYSAHQNHIWKTADGMHSWTALPSPSSGSPNAMAIAPTSPSTIYLSVGKSTWVSTSGGSAWTSTDASSCTTPSLAPNCGFGDISSLAVDPSDSRIVYATVTGYDTAGTQRAHVYRSTDSGTTWQDISTRLPNVPFQGIAISLNNTSVLYAAADIGVYISNDSGLTWSALGSFLPNARVFHLTMRGDQLVAWTHGRGAWKLDLTTVPPPAVAIVSLPTAGGGDSCRTTQLPRNDDNSSTLVNLGFSVNFFGTNYSSGYVNNNGNFTFDGPLSTFTPFPLTTTSRAILAPFFADVDTRGLGSDVVTYSYGNGSYFGRRAFCVDWVNVGYYAMHVDKLDSFQLLLVDRSDTGAGNFDIYFNVNKIQWETGDASGGRLGLGGSSARVGYSNGTNASFEMPGSAVNGYFLDSSPTALINSSRNSTVPGRYIFPVRNGVAPTGGSISGTVYANSVAPANTVSGARVQACNAAGFCWLSSSNSAGVYSIFGLAFDFYTVTVYPPSGSILNPGTVGPFVLSANQALTGQDVVLRGPTPPPPGTTLLPVVSTSGGLPVVYWTSSLTLQTNACAGGTAGYQISINGSVVRSGSMAEGPTGTYTATVAPLSPNHGSAQVVITVTCPDGSTVSRSFDIYIDPSGVVTSTAGQPLAGATVTLLRSDSSSGPFSAVPNGDPIMSPGNRNNPDLTDSAGQFGWDVLTGYYKVTASKPGCTSPSDPTQGGVESPVFLVPPPALNLTLQLRCAGPPTTTATPIPAPNAAGWNRSDVTVTLAANPATGGSPVQSITYSLSGAQSVASTVVAGNLASVTITAEGTTTLTYFATDTTGATETPKSLTIKLDKTPPAISGSRTPAPNSFGWNNTDVTVSFTCTDALSGVASSSSPTTLSAEGAGQSVTGTCTDVAGNSASATVSNVNIDKTPPKTTAAVSPTPNANGWNGTTGDVTLTATDALSGVDVTLYGIDGAAFVPYTAPFAITGQGVHTVLYRSTDRAGNVESTRTLTVKIDKTPPEAYLQFDPVTRDLVLFGRDGLSGVSPGQIAPQSVVPDKGKGEIRTYHVVDLAGNTLDVVVEVKRTGAQLRATITSLSYNGAPAVAPVDNTMKYEWSAPKGAPLDELHQLMETGRGDSRQEVAAEWHADAAQTVIHAPAGESIRPGLVLLRLATSAGQLAIEF